MTTAGSVGAVRDHRHLLGVSSYADLPYVSDGHGVYLRDEEGAWYLDGSSGALAANLGHGNAEMANAMHAQASRVAFAHRTQMRNRPAEQLAELIAAWTPDGLDRCMFVSSGSDANELALALAVRYWHANGGTDRDVLVTGDRSYHGATLGSLSLTGLVERHGPMRPLLRPVVLLPTPAPETGGPAIDQLIAEVRSMFAECGDRIAAVVVEAVSGTSGGAIVPPRRYLETINELCGETGALLIVDEVMTGFGRTGRAFACDHFGLQPDILTFGKGVSGGYAALAGVAVHSKVADTLAGLGGVGLGHTYMDVPISAAVGLAAARIVLDQPFLDSVEARGRELRDGLRAVQAQMPSELCAVRGIGLINAVDVTNHGDGPKTKTRRLLSSMRDNGLLLYPGAPHEASDSSHHIVMVAPPLTVTRGQIDELVQKFRNGLQAYAQWE